MSGPRFTITIGQEQPSQVFRRKARKVGNRVAQLNVLHSDGMYADRENVKRQPRQQQPQGREDLRNRIGSGGATRLAARLGGSAAGTTASTLRGTSVIGGKRQREDNNWQHDMYGNVEGRGAGTARVSQPVDLRNRLSRKGLGKVSAAGQQEREGGGQGAAIRGVRDLREKLSGVGSAVEASNMAPPPAKQRRVVSLSAGSARLLENGARSVFISTGPSGSRSRTLLESEPRTAVTNQRKAPPRNMQASSSPAQIVPATAKPGQQASKQQQQVLSNFLEKLGLEKYSSSFQKEEVDMVVLRHMKDDDLKELGIPMGPRKKILLAVAALA